MGKPIISFLDTNIMSSYITSWCVLRRETSGMIHFITINNHPSNPQQPIHSLRKTHQYPLVN